VFLGTKNREKKRYSIIFLVLFKNILNEHFRNKKQAFFIEKKRKINNMEKNKG